MKGKPQGGFKSEKGRAAYWRMQYESAIGALADLIAENTENVELMRQVAVDYGHVCGQTDACGCSIARLARLVTQDANEEQP